MVSLQQCSLLCEYLLHTFEICLISSIAILNPCYIQDLFQQRQNLLTISLKQLLKAKLSIQWSYRFHLTVCLDRQAGKMYFSLLHTRSGGNKGEGMNIQGVRKGLTHDPRSAQIIPMVTRTCELEFSQI
jgi:hypothetical protein